MSAPRRLLLAALLAMLPGARPQPSSSPPEPVSASSVPPGPLTPDATERPSTVETATPRDVAGVSTAAPTPEATSAPGSATTDVFPAVPICVCDLTPGACDLNCCCDKDCNLLYPMTVFSFCLPGSVRSPSWVCVDNSLIFRSNSPFPSRVFMSSNGIRQFCVHVNNSKLSYSQKVQTVNATNFQTLAAEFGGESFTSTLQTHPSPPPFYRAGDPILAYYPKWSVVSLLKQPAGVGAGGLCAENNPAGFLESRHTTCSRFFRNLASSCTLDPALDAASYYNFTVLKVPRALTDLQNIKFQIPVTIASEASPPLLSGNTCYNIVSKVIYEIQTNGTFGIQKVSVSFEQTNLTVEPGVSLQQDFIIHFRALQKSTAASTGPRSGNPGYIIGKPLLVLSGDLRHSMSLLQSQGDGICSVRRHEIQFGVNALSGCKLRLKEKNCSSLQEMIYQTLHGSPLPEHVAIFGNADPAQKGGWTRILTRNCHISAVDCTSCCFIPVSLEIQVLWAHIGLQSNPQAHVSGARFVYQCKTIQDHQKETEVSLTTLVNFVDITQKPEPPRSQPRTDWKLPFDLFLPFRVAFSRGVDSQKGPVSPVLILCLLLLGVLSSQTK
uniref:tectonic-3 isoform X2 n=1 Tax=Jaculus jaculus TaxID=51337 RepID=UPI001E1B0360|nr:tectonic-3 isoform X2 [Jaculus jaculus]